MPFKCTVCKATAPTREGLSHSETPCEGIVFYYKATEETSKEEHKQEEPSGESPVDNGYVPVRLDEMDDFTWFTYQESVKRNLGVHKKREKAILKKGEYLYHATLEKNLGSISKEGLCPRNPAWKKYQKKDRIPRYDASKDGYLSMSKTKFGAGAMGGKEVLLRMQIGEDIADWDWRQVLSTEVRSLKSIPPERLEFSKDKAKWYKLSTWTG